MKEGKNNLLKKYTRIIVIVLVILLCLVVLTFYLKNRKLNKIASQLKIGKENASYNTKYLQKLMDEVSSKGGGKIEIPEGTFYFDDLSLENNNVSPNKTERETYAIKCKSNVLIEGNGEEKTILKPITKDEFGIKNGIEMFYFNEFSDKGIKEYLENADFKNFTIDGDETKRTGKTSFGKGFMISLYRDCDWENVTVKNTDATGFGMDNPINSTIKNCTAINCGKAAKSLDTYEGSSGFGIGTGLGEGETIIIENCKAINNKKFGFFFEDQTRWAKGERGGSTDKDGYSLSKGFVVRNCIARDNMYNFGGLRATNVLYENCESKESIDFEIYFGENSRGIHLKNIKLNGTFSDVAESDECYDAIKWAKENAIIFGNSNEEFKVNEILEKKDAIIFIWRMMGYPGKVVKGNKTYYKLETGFSDIDSNIDYRTGKEGDLAAAIIWGKEKGIIEEDGSLEFNPNEKCAKPYFVNLISKTLEIPMDLEESSGNELTRKEAISLLYTYSNIAKTSGNSLGD